MGSAWNATHREAMDFLASSFARPEAEILVFIIKSACWFILQLFSSMGLLSTGTKIFLWRAPLLVWRLLFPTCSRRLGESGDCGSIYLLFLRLMTRGCGKQPSLGREELIVTSSVACRCAIVSISADRLTVETAARIGPLDQDGWVNFCRHTAHLLEIRK